MLRSLYSPIQPKVTSTTINPTYQEWLPTLALQSMIYCYWQLQTTQPLQESYTYSVVADGCIDIIIDLDNPEESFVMGFCKHSTDFLIGKSFNYLGIRFLPSVFPQYFKVDAALLAQSVTGLALVLPQLSTFILQNIDSRLPFYPIRQVLDAYFLPYYLNGSDEDKRLSRAISLILKQAGNIRVEQQLDTGISPRQLRRLFGFYIGDSAKAFSQVVRFQKILYTQSVTKVLFQQTMHDAGYYDQAHFIKEFKLLYGTTPRHAFR